MPAARGSISYGRGRSAVLTVHFQRLGAAPARGPRRPSRSPAARVCAAARGGGPGLLHPRAGQRDQMRDLAAGHERPQRRRSAAAADRPWGSAPGRGPRAESSSGAAAGSPRGGPERPRRSGSRSPCVSAATCTSSQHHAWPWAVGRGGHLRPVQRAHQAAVAHHQARSRRASSFSWRRRRSRAYRSTGSAQGVNWKRTVLGTPTATCACAIASSGLEDRAALTSSTIG